MGRKNPYQMLLETAREWADESENLRHVFMWQYPKDNINGNWSLGELAERVAAADQIGFDVILKNDKGNLQVWYRKRPPGRPWQLRW